MVQSENHKNYLKFELDQKCPNHLCNKKIKVDDLFNYFDKEESNQINNILLDKYLANESNIRKCPSKECDNAAWFNPTLNQNCAENYVCEKCNFSWKDPSSNKYSFKEFIKQPITFFKKDLSNINVNNF